MGGHPCVGCGAVVADTFTCRDCTEQLQHHLWSVRALVEELDVALARQAVVAPDGAGVRSASAETPLPFGWAASEAAWNLNRTLAAWVTALAPGGPRAGVALAKPARTINPRDPAAIPEIRSQTAALAGWLAARVDDLGRHTDAADALDQIGYAVRTGWSTVDRAPERRFAGPCSAETLDEDGDTIICDADVYARPGATTVLCRWCDTEHPVDTRRAFLLDAARDQLVTAVDASRALPDLLGRPFTASVVRNLAARGRLTQHPPHHPDGPPLYTVGDIIDVLIAQEADTAIQRTRPRRAG